MAGLYSSTTWSSVVLTFSLTFMNRTTCISCIIVTSSAFKTKASSKATKASTRMTKISTRATLPTIMIRSLRTIAIKCFFTVWCNFKCGFGFYSQLLSFRFLTGTYINKNFSQVFSHIFISELFNGSSSKFFIFCR